MSEEEINRLEYRPSFERQKRDKTNWVTSTPTSGEKSPSLQAQEKDPEVGSGLVTTIVGASHQVQHLIDQAMKELDKNLQLETFYIEEKFADDIQRAKEALGLTGDRLTFGDYTTALKDIHTPAGSYLVELIEDQIEDLDGSMELELYQDYFEIQQEFQLLNKYIDKVLLSAMEIEPIDTQQENWQKDLEQQELLWAERKNVAQNEFDSAYGSYKGALLRHPERLNATQGRLHEQEKGQQFYQTQSNQANEALTLVKDKTEELANIFFNMEDEREREPYTNAHQLIEGIKVVADSPVALSESLNQFQLMLKLSLDVHNKEKHHLKNSLRGIYDPTNQEKVLDELTVYNNVFMNETLPALHTLNGYQSEQEDELSVMLTEVALGLQETHQQKRQKTKEMYNTVRSSSRLRQRKLQQVTEKDNARQAYHLLQAEKEHLVNNS